MIIVWLCNLTGIWGFRGACQISKRLERCKYESRGFETSRDLAVRRPPAGIVNRDPHWGNEVYETLGGGDDDGLVKHNINYSSECRAISVYRDHL